MSEKFSRSKKEDPSTVSKDRTRLGILGIQTDRVLLQYEQMLGINLLEMKGKLVLDIGSGENESFSKEAAKVGINVVSMSPHLKDDFFDKHRFLRNWQKRSVAGVVQELPFKEDTFDYEVALFSVPHYLYLAYNPQEGKPMINEIVRTLKPGGKAYFSPISAQDKPRITKILTKLNNLISYKFTLLDNSQSPMIPEAGDEIYSLILIKKS